MGAMGKWKTLLAHLLAEALEAKDLKAPARVDVGLGPEGDRRGAGVVDDPGRRSDEGSTLSQAHKLGVTGVILNEQQGRRQGSGGFHGQASYTRINPGAHAPKSVVGA